LASSCDSPQNTDRPKNINIKKCKLTLGSITLKLKLHFYGKS